MGRFDSELWLIPFVARDDSRRKPLPTFPGEGPTSPVTCKFSRFCSVFCGQVCLLAMRELVSCLAKQRRRLQARCVRTPSDVSPVGNMLQSCKPAQQVTGWLCRLINGICHWRPPGLANTRVASRHSIRVWRERLDGRGFRLPGGLGAGIGIGGVCKMHVFGHSQSKQSFDVHGLLSEIDGFRWLASSVWI